MFDLMLKLFKTKKYLILYKHILSTTILLLYIAYSKIYYTGCPVRGTAKFREHLCIYISYIRVIIKQGAKLQGRFLMIDQEKHVPKIWVQK